MTKPALRQCRILTVDDVPDVCEAVKAMLAFDGHVVETAGSGKEALAMFERNKYDLIFVNYVMPVMEGDELAAAIKARDPGQLVVMLTARADMLRRRPTPLKHVDLILDKPFTLADLREAIAKVPGSRSTGGAEASEA